MLHKEQKAAASRFESYSKGLSVFLSIMIQLYVAFHPFSLFSSLAVAHAGSAQTVINVISHRNSTPGSPLTHVNP